MHRYFVRLGAMAEVYTARWPVSPLQRNRRVIVRTARGLELAEVVGPCRQDAKADESEYRIVRPTSDEDELLIRRLERHKRAAVEACRSALTESGSQATLLDVDQLLDGGTLIMHFLGPVDAKAESITSDIVERYESVVRTRHFARLLQEGCGPGCGTENGRGCGDRCAGCSSAAACRSH